MITAAERSEAADRRREATAAEPEREALIRSSSARPRREAAAAAGSLFASWPLFVRSVVARGILAASCARGASFVGRSSLLVRRCSLARVRRRSSVVRRCSFVGARLRADNTRALRCAPSSLASSSLPPPAAFRARLRAFLSRFLLSTSSLRLRAPPCRMPRPPPSLSTSRHFATRQPAAAAASRLGLALLLRINASRSGSAAVASRRRSAASLRSAAVIIINVNYLYGTTLICIFVSFNLNTFLIMAKGNMLLGYARGKVGDLVFTRRNGEQVTRPRVRVVNNPKTEGQQIQRMIFASVIAAYARMKSICDHSFEGVKYGADSQAKFMSENLKRLRAYYPSSGNPDVQPVNGMAFSLPNDRAAAGTGLIIAKGSLAAPTPAVSAAGVLSGFGTAPGDVKISSVLASLGAVPGDQITIVGLLDLGDGYSFVKSRYVVDVNATSAQLEANWSESGTAAAFDAEKTIVGSLKLFASADTPSTVEDDSREQVAVGIIISRRDESGKWLRSDAILYNTMDEAPLYQADYALHYWQFEGTDIVTDNSHYLNNADI